MGENSDYDKALILNTVYQHSLPVTNTTKPPLSKKIITPLLPHQQALVQGLHAHCEKMTRGIILGHQAIHAKLGIIADPAGTGKSLSVLSYLATHTTPALPMTMELTPHSTRYFFSHDLHEVTPHTHLIIVPQLLIGQWRQDIEKHTTLTCITIDSKRIIKGTELAEHMKGADVVLTTNKCYKYVQAYATHHRIQWNHVVMDEASSIYMHSSDPPLHFQFLWLMTHQWIPLLFKNASIIKSNVLFLRDKINMHPELEHWLLDNITAHYQGELVSPVFLKEYLSFSHPLRAHLVIRNSTAAVHASVRLPPVVETVIQCKPNISLQSLTSYYLAKNLKLSIRTERIPHLFQSLGIACTPIAEYLPFQLVSKHGLIQSKVEENECMICLEPCQYPTIVHCCYNLYCGKCLLKNTLLTYKCPTCRNGMDVNSMCCLTPLTEEMTMMTKNKMDVCVDKIEQQMAANKNAKIIVYSAFDNIYYQMFEQMDQAGIKAERLEANVFSFLKIVRNFKEGKTNVVFVSNVTILRGLSLPLATHLIFYHDLPSCEMKEVLLHSAQRVGRTQPLSVIHLTSEIQL